MSRASKSMDSDEMTRKIKEKSRGRRHELVKSIAVEKREEMKSR